MRTSPSNLNIAALKHDEASLLLSFLREFFRTYGTKNLVVFSSAAGSLYALLRVLKELRDSGAEIGGRPLVIGSPDPAVRSLPPELVGDAELLVASLGDTCRHLGKGIRLILSTHGWEANDAPMRYVPSGTPAFVVSASLVPLTQPWAWQGSLHQEVFCADTSPLPTFGEMLLSAAVAVGLANHEFRTCYEVRACTGIPVPSEEPLELMAFTFSYGIRSMKSISAKKVLNGVQVTSPGKLPLIFPKGTACDAP